MSKRALEDREESPRDAKKKRLERTESTVAFLSSAFPAVERRVFSADDTTFFVNGNEIYLPMELYVLFMGQVP